MTTTLLATAAQAASGTSAAVDVSALAILRADIDLGATSLPGGGELSVSLDHGPTSSGPWAELQTFLMATGAQPGSPYTWPAGKKRVVLSGFDAFMRVRWTAKSTWGTPALTLGVSG
jgi:hypothetical protein